MMTSASPFLLPVTPKSLLDYLLIFHLHFSSLKEINEILGEKLSAEDEEEILAEFENLETQVCNCF